MDATQLRYTETHEWVHWDGSTATVGITDFAVSQLTDLVYVDLPKVGKQITAGEPCGEIESVKAVGELNAPLSGEITAVNEDLDEHLEYLSDSPFEKGWILKMKPSNPTAIDSLLDYSAYKQICDNESH